MAGIKLYFHEMAETLRERERPNRASCRTEKIDVYRLKVIRIHTHPHSLTCAKLIHNSIEMMK